MLLYEPVNSLCGDVHVVSRSLVVVHADLC
jgi:hypothetical protein